MTDPITRLIDKTEELMGHSPHPAIVTVPLGAWTVTNVCDVLAMASGRSKYDDAARLSLAVGLVGAAGAVVTGLRNYSHIPRERPSHSVATTHAIGNAAVGSLMAASYVLRVADHRSGRRTRLLARVLGLAGGALSLYTGWLGGKLVEEMGEGVKPVMHAMQQAESDALLGADDGHGRDRLDPDSPLGRHHLASDQAG